MEMKYFVSSILLIAYLFSLGIAIDVRERSDPEKSGSRRKLSKWWNKKIFTEKEAVLAKSDFNQTLSVGRRKAKKRTRKIKPARISNCQHYVKSHGIKNKATRLWYRRHRKPEMAYRMAATAGLSYWEFHKWGLPANKSDFGLTTYSRGMYRNETFLFRISQQARFYACRLRRGMSRYRRSVWSILNRSSYMGPGISQSNETLHGRLDVSPCDEIQNKSRRQDPSRLSFQYWLYNWYETGLAGVNFHDTDVLISTSNVRKILVLSFAGTSSAADAVTNLQTFEPANHSGFFHAGTNTSVQGSLHRGFLNAYSRVDKGSVVRLCTNCTAGEPSVLDSLHKRFGHCSLDKKKRKKKKNPHGKSRTDEKQMDNVNHNDTNTSYITEENEHGSAEEDRTSSDKPDHVRERRSGGCRSQGEKLVDVLRELVTFALRSGYTVHATGHSLGGVLASLLAVDMVVNFPDTPVSRLHLWTFGSPQVGDDVFLESAMAMAPRLESFVRENGNGRFHRYVTLSNDCKADVVSEVARSTLPSHDRNFRGRIARSLGGVHGHIIHLAEPHYLLTPDQYYHTANNGTSSKDRGNFPEAKTTRSTVAAHAMVNYLQGISRESRKHPIHTDFPKKIAEWLGEE